MLNQADQHIIRWIRDGAAFKVFDHERFINEVLPKYRHSFESFQYNLNSYGFKRISRGTDVDAYYSFLFIKGREDLTERK
jgi:hypothetical protein